MDDETALDANISETVNMEGEKVHENVEEEKTFLHEEVEGQHAAGEHIMEGEQVEEEHVQEKQGEDEDLEGEHNERVTESERTLEEALEGEALEEEKAEGEDNKEELKVEEVEEEETYVEEPPPDPTAPFNFSDSSEALKEPFKLRPEQLAEIEQLWEYYQNYTPAYTDIENYITDKELFYMLKALLLMTVTEEQFYELIAYCVRPPHPKGHINFDQFVKMVTIRQRDTPIEDELRSALQVLDPEKTGSVDRETLKELLAKQGYKMSPRHLDNLIKEVDISNDGTLGIEDIVGTMCIDLNKEDLQLLLASIYPPDQQHSLAEDD